MNDFYLRLKQVTKWALITELVVFSILFFSLKAYAQIPLPANLWKGLIAEDVAGGYQGMYAVACCVRNRLNAGMGHGLCGLKRKDLNSFVKKEGKRAEITARKIIQEVFYDGTKDITLGATHFESIRFQKPKWAYKMKIICRIGEHVFYKDK